MKLRYKIGWVVVLLPACVGIALTLYYAPIQTSIIVGSTALALGWSWLLAVLLSANFLGDDR